MFNSTSGTNNVYNNGLTIWPVDHSYITSFLDGQNEFSQKEYSKKYLLEMKNLLSQILDGALTDGYITINPAKDSRIVIPSEKKKERRALSIDEIKQAIQALTKLQGRDLLFWAIIIFTGMRRGEVLALRWEDIDLQNNIIHVNNNVTFDGNRPRLGKTKTSSGERKIPMQPKLLDYILPLKGNGFVVGGSDEPITLTTCRGIINRGLKAIGIDGISAHYFRHSLGTLLNDVGADTKTIQSILGHSDFKTTMDRYVHSRKDRSQEAMCKLNTKLAS